MDIKEVQNEISQYIIQEGINPNMLRIERIVGIIEKQKQLLKEIDLQAEKNIKERV